MCQVSMFAPKHPSSARTKKMFLPLGQSLPRNDTRPRLYLLSQMSEELKQKTLRDKKYLIRLFFLRQSIHNLEVLTQ